MTGTPLDTQGPKVLEPALHIIDTNLAKSIPRLVELYEDALHKRTREYMDDFTREFQRVFSHDIVLRFTHQTRFLDQPISNTQTVQPVIVSRRLPRLGFSRTPLQHLIARGKTRLPTHLPHADALDASEATRQVRDELYFVSLFPGAARLIASGRIAVHERAMRDAIRALGDARADVHRIPEVHRFWQEAVADSPKARAVVHEADRMSRDQRARRLLLLPPPTQTAAPARPGGGPPRARQQPGRVDPTWKKMVVVTPTVASAVYLYMHLRRAPELLARGVHTVLYHQDLSQRQRTALQADFNRLDPRDRNSTRASIMVGSFDALGTGIGLQAASYQVLTSPPARADDLAQAFARTNREGQMLPVAHRVLVLEESPVDRINMAALARRDLASDPYDMAAGVELRPVRDAPPGGRGGRRVVVNGDHEDLYKMNQRLARMDDAGGAEEEPRGGWAGT